MTRKRPNRSKKKGGKGAKGGSKDDNESSLHLKAMNLADLLKEDILQIACLSSSSSCSSASNANNDAARAHPLCKILLALVTVTCWSPTAAPMTPDWGARMPAARVRCGTVSSTSSVSQCRLCHQTLVRGHRLVRGLASPMISGMPRTQVRVRQRCTPSVSSSTIGCVCASLASALSRHRRRSQSILRIKMAKIQKARS